MNFKSFLKQFSFLGKIALIIPWTSLYSLPVIATLEDVFVLAGPVTDRGYDEAKERALQDAVKKKILEDLESTAGKREIEGRNSQVVTFLCQLSQQHAVL